MAASLLVWRGHVWVALAVLFAVGGILQAKAVSPAFARRFEHALDRLAHAVAHGVGLALSWTLLSLVFVAVVVPVWVLGFPFRRRGLGRPRGVDGDGWVERTAVPAPAHRTYAHERGFADAAASAAPEPEPPTGPEPAADTASEPPSEVRRATRRRHPVLVGIGVVAVVLLADLALGAVLVTTGLRDSPRGDTRRFVEDAVNETMSAPPIADEPWVDEYRAALIAYQLDGGSYTPFLVSAPRAFASESLNTTDVERVSYVPDPAGASPLRVAFFGGSTMFGVGQRDEHTIPSAVARVAEESGIPLEVHNYGLPGWVSWQELQYLERLLARGERYDLVVFYDGFNELLVQGVGYSRDPTHLGADVMNNMAADYQEEHQVAPQPSDGLAELTEAYRRNSGMALLLGRADDDPTDSQGGIRRAVATPEAQATAALAVYDRATDLVTLLAAEHGMTARFFWQPTRAGWPPSITEQLPDGVVDLSGVLDGRQDELYIDEVHTNEEGARLVAEAIWAEIGPDLAAVAAARAETEQG